MKRHALIAVIGVALAGCGGGGGGGGTGGGTGGTPPVRTLAPGDPIPQDGQAFQVSGQAVSTVIEGAGNRTSPFTGSTAATANVSATSPGRSRPDRIAFTSFGETVDVDFTNITNTTSLVGGGILAEADADGSTVLTDTRGRSFDFTTYGGWAQARGANATPIAGDIVNFGAFGAPTDPANMPSGPATYTGTSIGLVEGRTEVFTTTSDITVQTPDYSSITVTSSGTLADNGTGGTQSANLLDFTATGTVTGSGYAASNGTMTATGNFFGPAAEETSGTFSGTQSGLDYGGAFGAKR